MQNWNVLCNAVVTFIRVYRGAEKATRKFQRVEEIGFSFVRARNPTKRQLFLHRGGGGERSRLYHPARSAEYIVK